MIHRKYILMVSFPGFMFSAPHDKQIKGSASASCNFYLYRFRNRNLYPQRNYATLHFRIAILPVLIVCSFCLS